MLPWKAYSIRSSGLSLKKHKVMFFHVMFTIHTMKTVISLIKIQLNNRAGDTKLWGVQEKKSFTLWYDQKLPYISGSLRRQRSNILFASIRFNESNQKWTVKYTPTSCCYDSPMSRAHIKRKSFREKHCKRWTSIWQKLLPRFKVSVHLV